MEAGGSEVEAEDINGNTPLMLAAWNGHVTTVIYLVDQGPISLNLLQP